MAKDIWVYADWVTLNGPRLMGRLHVDQERGKETFSFNYDKEWLTSGIALKLDPDLDLFTGPQYVRNEKPNFGIFTDSSPDRWGRVLMKRKEAFLAGQEKRKPRTLLDSDYLLNVSDQYRMGAIRFKLDPDGSFVDENEGMTAPPITSLRSLENASLEMEKADAENNPHFREWLKILLAPGSSLGGARPKASVIYPDGHLWIAKFPSNGDEYDKGAWEAVLNVLAKDAGINVAEGLANRYTRQHHTFLTKRFDRLPDGKRIHFASAMTLLGLTDGADGSSGISYLNIAEFIMQQGAQPDLDMVELWKRIVFSICVGNTDDHLRNHGFLLSKKGWELSPAYDLNPNPDANGLSLNISENDNSMNLDLARSVAPFFRLSAKNADVLIKQITIATARWQEEATRHGIPRSEITQMRTAFLAG